MGKAKKDYFKEPTAAEIIKENRPVYAGTDTGIVSKVLGLEEGEYLALNSKVIPGSFRDAKRFLMNASPIELKSPDSIDEAVQGAMTPGMAREEAMAVVNHPFHSGYGFRPFDENDDRRQRIVRLVELCEAVRIMSYGMQTGDDIRIGRVYSGNNSSKSGSIVSVSVPSRTMGSKDYVFQMRSVATDPENVSNYAIANGFNTTISIPASDWAFGFGEMQKGGSKTIHIFAPEIAAYFKFMSDPRNETSKKMSPFAVPTDLMVEFYRSLLSNVLMHDKAVKAGHKLRKLNKAEQEIMLWSLVQETGYSLSLKREDYETPVGSIDWAIANAAKE
jgi:hypothetical protein